MKLKNFKEFKINEMASKPDSIEYTFEAELGDAESGYEIYKVEMEVSYYWEDSGIGHYEFGGTKGYDSRVYPEIDEFKIIDVKIIDENGESKDVELTDELKSNLIGYAQQDEIENIVNKIKGIDPGDYDD